MSNSFFGAGNKSKPLSVSCQNCNRLTVIEGETICFKGGEIIRLTPYEPQNSKLSLLCDGWRPVNTSKSA
ncbi:MULTISPECIES: hypothetical protein [unclassified Shewanella]|uniref:hypothetical protein n=1 Tax=unclassified Shewanella TaxID=196818 RepID=UPI0009E25E03|nr:hypothetical protein [Shewanella sp. cp20]MCG9721315.1 hypothetical protein [Shewanella sp. Isolate7]MCG9745383.1 hypothetical protein [Shewanella sp. Isolate8]MCL2909765.1 hypothetical protein [Shewanella aquimarina]